MGRRWGVIGTGFISELRDLIVTYWIPPMELLAEVGGTRRHQRSVPALPTIPKHQDPRSAAGEIDVLTREHRSAGGGRGSGTEG